MIPSRIVDAHHHLWDIAAVNHPWLRQKGVKRFFGDPAPIQHDYLADDFRADHDGLPVVASVHIQVGTAPGEEVNETRWLERHAEATGLPTTIIAFADLTAPNLCETLDAHAGASPRLRGIRQIVSRHPSEDAASGTVALLDDPRFLAGLKELSRRRLSFDLQLSAPLLDTAAELFAGVPDLPVALCHVGSPWDQSPDGLTAWRAGLHRFAALPNAVAKISGLGMFDRRWTRDSLAPVVEGILEAFGPTRTMWGSNFPVDKLYNGYRPLLETVASLVPEAMHDAVFAETASRFYRLH